ncbi:hypothetical protein Bca4012_091476 [Brassica carinata]|uniref:Ubiquitin-like domain-containing protein n=1 Tax=Brassica carinata TaxID=52824 RepID=A0A8X7P451_BRACI|nr:hypothetical protein Bca52824_085242 [Brassica carinata]
MWKLWKKCGTCVNAMALELYDESGSNVAALSDDSRPLGFYLMGKLELIRHNRYHVSILMAKRRSSKQKM